MKESKPAPKSWATITIIMSLIVGLTIVAIRLLSREPPLTQVATMLGQKIFEGDSTYLSERVLEEELVRLNWNREHAKRFLEEVVLPKRRGQTYLKNIDVNLYSKGAKAVANYQYRDANGTSVDSSSSVILTDHGGRCTITNLLLGAWLAEYRQLNAAKLVEGWQMRAVKNGIVKDYTLLKRFGFRSFTDMDESRNNKSLDKAYTDAKAWLAAHPE